MIPITQHLLHARAEADRLKYLLVGLMDWRLDRIRDEDAWAYLERACTHLESATERITEAVRALGVEVRP